MSRLSSFLQAPRLARRGVVCFSVAAVLLCLVACLVLQSRHNIGLLETANKIGPSARSLVEGNGLAVCYGDSSIQPVACDHAQRLPVAPVTVAVLYLLFGQHTLIAALVKTLVFLLPVLLTFALAWGSVSRHLIPHAPPTAKLVTLSLFFLAILLPPLLDVAVNLNFEEAYFYSWLALAVALLLFRSQWQAHPLRWVFTLWLSLAFVYLTKSSMLPTVGFLSVAAVATLARKWRSPILAAALLIACISLPLAWGVCQHHASGRFTVGTSLDGVNLYKGNNSGVIARYPAFRGASLDGTEAFLFAGNVSPNSDRTGEWAENDFASAQARAYIRTHPAETLRLDLRKATVFFLGVQRNLGEDPYPRFIEFAFDIGLLLFRLMLLAALAFAVRDLLTKPGRRFRAFVFFGCVGCTAIPYIIGFALTRHSLVLILPTAAYLSSLFAAPEIVKPPSRSRTHAQSANLPLPASTTPAVASPAS